MMRVLRAVFVATVLFVPLSEAPRAMAHDCTGLDPTCTVDDTVGTAHQAAGDAASTAKGTTDQGVTTARNTVDGLVQQGGTPPPGGGGGGGSDPRHGGEPRGTSAPGGNRHRGSGAQQTASSVAASPAAAPDPAPSAQANDGASGRSGRGTTPTISQVAAGVIGGVAVMAFLLGAIAVFLLIQDRLDRRDPKLLPDSLGSDQVLFT